MKKLFIFMIIAYLLVTNIFLTSCGNSIDMNYSIVSDAKQYSKIERDKLQGDLEDALSIFPKNIDGLNCIQYLYRTDYQVMDDETQLIISISYTENEFQREIERLAAITFKEQIHYDISSFSMPAYVATMGFSGQYEYALIEEQTCTIHYVHLRFVKEPTMEQRFLPNYFRQYCLETENSFTIYYSKLS